MLTDWHFYLAAIPAVILMGISKGGFAGLSVLSTPLLALAISPVRAAAIMLPILIVQDAVSVWSYRHSFVRRTLALMLPGSMLGILLGWLLAARVSDALVGLVVGLIAVAFVGLALARGLGWLAAARARRPSAAPAAFWGTVAGFTSFISHAGGPPFQVYALPLGLPTQVYVGTTTLFFAVTNFVKLAPYLALGQFSRDNLTLSTELFPLAIVSTLAGVWLVRRVSQAGFLRIIYALTFAVGCMLVWDGVAAVRLAAP